MYQLRRMNKMSWDELLRLGAGYAQCGNEMNEIRSELDCVINVMALAQKPVFVFRRNGRVHLNRRGRQFSRLLAAEVGVSAVVMLDTPCSEVVWRVLATHSIRQFTLHLLSLASPCAITFKLDPKHMYCNRPGSVVQISDWASRRWADKLVCRPLASWN
jgi:hypothetical protein